MFTLMLALLLTLLACSPVSDEVTFAEDDTAVDTGAATSLAQDSGAAWCLTVEDASLATFGYPGDHAEPASGVEIFVAAEGADFSELEGEEALDLPGQFSVGLRAVAGERWAQVTTPLFTITEDALVFTQLSEADHRGVELVVELLAANGELLGQGRVPALTGGYIPAMPSDGGEDSDSLDEEETASKANTGNGGTTSTQSSAGVFSPQQLDLSAWRGQSARLRFSQRSVMERVAFFTLLDDLCHQAPSAEAAVVPLTAR